MKTAAVTEIVMAVDTSNSMSVNPLSLTDPAAQRAFLVLTLYSLASPGRRPTPPSCGPAAPRSRGPHDHVQDQRVGGFAGTGTTTSAG